jgi:gliding motility-associated-like protein
VSKPYVLFLALLFSYGFAVWNPNLWAQQAEQDCINALPVCRGIYSQPNSYIGAGNNSSEINRNISCLLQGERNGVWYVINVSSDGELIFNITPRNNSDDYDWAVFNLTNANCSDIARDHNLQVSCNYSSTPGRTGAVRGGTSNSQPAAGSPFNAPITVRGGEKYYLYISNYSSTQYGYTLNFLGSTAGVLDTIAPTMKAINGILQCGGRNLEITFSKGILCNSVQTTDFLLTGPRGSIHRIIAATNPGCNPNNPNSYAEIYALTIAPPLTDSGRYTLSLVDTVFDYCYNPAFSGTLFFNVEGVNTIIDEDTLRLCPNASGVQLRGKAIGAQGPFTYEWSPQEGLSNPFIPDPIAKPLQTTVYKLVAKSFNCASAPDSVTVLVEPNPPTKINGDTAVCLGQETHISLSGWPRYRWLPPINLITNRQRLRPPQTTIYNIIPESRYCTGDTVKLKIRIKPNPDMKINAPSGICVTESAKVGYAGTTSNASFLWDFDGATSETSSGAGPFELKWQYPGSASIRMMAELEGCKDSLTHIIKIDPPVIHVYKRHYEFCGPTSFVPLIRNVQGVGCSYSWEPAARASLPNILTPVISVEESGMLYLNSACGFCKSRDSIFVRVNALPTVSVTHRSVNFCQGQGGVQLEAKGGGGKGKLAYLWQPNTGLDSIYSPTPRANPTFSVLYKITVQDSMGCLSHPDSVLVTIHPTPTVLAPQDVILCKNEPGILLSAYTNYENAERLKYHWSPENEIISGRYTSSIWVRPQQNQLFSLWVEDTLTSCKSSILGHEHTTIVRVVPNPRADAGPDKYEICQGEKVQLGGPAEASATNIIYLWQPSHGIDSDKAAFPWASPGQTTVYTLVVVANGCASEPDSVSVIVKPKPKVSITPEKSVICEGDSIILSLRVAPGGDNYQIHWLPNRDIKSVNKETFMIRPKKNSNYYGWVTLGGCTSDMAGADIRVISRGEVRADSLRREGGIVVCDTFILPAIAKNPEFFQFLWSPAVTLSDSSLLNPRAFPTVNTWYYLTATSGSCSLRDSILLIPAPKIKTSLQASKNKICKGDTLELRAQAISAGEVYEWTPKRIIHKLLENKVIIKPDTTVKVELLIRSGECQKKDTLTISVFPKPLLNVTPSALTGCAGSTIYFQDKSSQVNARIWSIGDETIRNEMNPSFYFPRPGKFTLKYWGYSKEGCKDSLSFPIRIGNKLEAQFITFPPVDTLEIPAAIIRLKDITPNSYQRIWDMGDGTSDQRENFTHQYRRAGEYQIRLWVQDELGCQDSTSKKLWVIEPQLILPNVFTPNDDGVNDFWEINYTGSETLYIKIFDRWGRLVYQSNSRDPAWNGKDTTGAIAPEGQYTYRITIGKKQYSGTFTLLR